MAAFISIQPSDFFQTVLWAGNDTARTITGVGFEDDFFWVKNRTGDGYNGCIYQSVDGPGSNKENIVDTNAALGGGNSATYGYVSAFTADGFSLGEGSTNDDYVNKTTHNYVGWNWAAGTTSVPSGGTITPSACSLNVSAGIGIYKFAGNSTAGANIAHGLGAIPSAIIVKRIDTTGDWTCYHKNMGNTKILVLNTASASATNDAWDDTTPTDTLFYLGDATNTNHNTGTYIAYVFAPVKGYSSFGLHRGHSSNVDGSYIHTGFRPNMVIIKNIDGGDVWVQQNVKCSPFNPVTKYLIPDSNADEDDDSTMAIDFLSNGFKIRGANNAINYLTQNYVHWAWAEFPMVSSNGDAGVAR